MPLYIKQEREAERDYPSQPARAAKIRSIRREARSRLVALGITYTPSIQDFAFEPPEAILQGINRTMDIIRHGRSRCREMINRPLPYVVAYDAETDAEWPS